MTILEQSKSMMRCLIKASTTKQLQLSLHASSSAAFCSQSKTAIPAMSQTRFLLTTLWGNSVSAVDIYGFGVRIGLYLQSVAITITTFRQFGNLIRSAV
jgi:hypothetical protein